MSTLKFKGQPKITYVVLHHTAVRRTQQPLQLDAVNTYHKNKDWGGGWKQPAPSELGWWGGYNFFVEPTGDRTQFRKIGEETIAQRGHNCDIDKRCDAISYCLAGDFRYEKPTELQITDLISFLREVLAYYPDVQLVQHKDLQTGRTCAALSPAELEQWMNEARGIGKTKDQIIAVLRAENTQLRQLVKKLVTILTTLLSK